MDSIKGNGERRDCTIDLTPVEDWGPQMKDIGQQVGASSKQVDETLGDLRGMVTGGRPVCIIIMPKGVKFEASNKDTFYESMKRLSALRPMIMVFGGK